MDNEVLKLIASLDEREAIHILRKMAKEDSRCKDMILSEIHSIFSEVSVESVAKAVFDSLDSVPIEDCWEQAGETRWGTYRDVGDVAYDIASDIMRIHVQEMERYGKLGGTKVGRMYLQGILLGLHTYRSEADSDFSIYIEELPDNRAEDLIKSWLRIHPESEQETKHLRAFIEDQCPDWQFLFHLS